MINIKGLKKSDVLIALWKNSKAQGMSFMGLQKGGMTKERAEEIIKDRALAYYKSKVNYLSYREQPTDEYMQKFEEWYKTNPEFRIYLDYVDGHVIKCDISGDEFSEVLYDRDCGEGAAQEAITKLKEGKLDELDSLSEEEEDFFGCLLQMAYDQNKNRNYDNWGTDKNGKPIII